MILSDAKMADIRKFSKNVQERNVIETLDADIAELRKALQWSLDRISQQAWLDERFQAHYQTMIALAYSKPTEEL